MARLEAERRAATPVQDSDATSSSS
jgi:hypothetical protein